MRKLKSCPFCGDEMKLYSPSWTDRVGISHTGNNECIISYCLPYLYKTKKLAIETWNKRV